MSLSNRQVGEFLETQSADTVLDMIAEALDESMLEAFAGMCSEHGSEYRISCTLFSGAIMDRVAESVSKDEEALAMFSNEQEDDCSDVVRDDNRDRASACNEIINHGYAS